MRILKSTFLVLILATVTLGWIGCESNNDITGPPDPDSRYQTGHAGRLQVVDSVTMHSGRNRSNPFNDGSGMGGHYAETEISWENGGTLSFWNGSLEISPESIDQTKVIWARTYSLSRGDFFKKIYDFGPSGTTFNPPATLTLSYCDLGPLPPNILKLRVFNEATQQWEIAGYMVNNPEEKTFTGPIEHFSRYSLSGNSQTLRPKVE